MGYMGTCCEAHADSGKDNGSNMRRGLNCLLQNTTFKLWPITMFTEDRYIVHEVIF